MFKTVNKDFYIDRLGFAYDHKFKEDFEFHGESHNFTEIGYVDSGYLELVSDGTVYHMKAGDIVFHRPMSFHKLRISGASHTRFINLSFLFGGSIPDKIYKGVYCLTWDECCEFLEIYDLAEKFINSSDLFDLNGQESSERLSAFILKLCRRNSLSNNISSDTSAIMFNNIVTEMQNNVYTNATVQDFADKCHISVSYVKLLFKKYADISPKNYFLHLKANQAANLILSGKSVNFVSESMGFSSPNYFSVFFKNRFGVTPKEFRLNADKAQKSMI